MWMTALLSVSYSGLKRLMDVCVLGTQNLTGSCSCNANVLRLKNETWTSFNSSPCNALQICCVLVQFFGFIFAI